MQNYTTEQIRNIAIVGHGGVGKTMLIEHLLYTAGSTERLGNIEAGNTQSDHDALEIRRKISLSATILPSEWHGCKLNLIDVPGYPDFIGDLHAVARAVEGFIIVCEAKRELDVGFELAWEVAEQYGLAKCIFVNKLERDNADYEGLLETLHARYGRKVVGVQIPIGHQAAFSGVLDVLSMKVYKGKDRGEEVEEIPSGYTLEAAHRREKMMDAAAEGDDDLAIKYLEGAELTESEIEHGLLLGIETGRVVPIMLGSAMSGIGVATLLDRICSEMPSPVDAPKDINGVSIHHPDSQGPVTPSPSESLVSLCFKTTADPYVGKINYLRVYSGVIQSDDIVLNVNREKVERMHNLFYSHGKSQEPATHVVAGDICAVAKLADTHTGDTLSASRDPIMLGSLSFPSPIFRKAIIPKTKSDEDKLPAAIQKIVEEDPTIHLYNDPSTHQIVIEGMGDIHLDTVIERLKSKFGVAVNTGEAQVPFQETIRQSAKAQGRFKRQSGGKGQFGDCWIEISPLERGKGFEFESRVVGGAIPKNFIPAIEKGILEEMAKGPVAGHPLTDIKVVVYDGSYHDVDSNEMAFKQAGALALRAALDRAAPVVLEPIVSAEIVVGDEYVGEVVSDLNGRRGIVQGLELDSSGKRKIKALVPVSQMQSYALLLRSITKGRGRFNVQFSHYEETSGPIGVLR